MKERAEVAVVRVEGGTAAGAAGGGTGIERDGSGTGVDVPVAQAVERLLAHLGGMGAFVSDGDTVLIKPNAGFVKDYTTGAVTNPAVVRAVALAARRAGAKRIIVAEGAAVGNKTAEAFTATGLLDLCSELHLELVDFKNDEFVPHPIPGGRILKRLHLPKTLLEADVVINIPVMKTHDAMPVTLGLKNMKGIVRECDKKRFHKWGLSDAIVDLNVIAAPDLTILDGTVGMEGLGPVHGDPVGLGVLIGSTDTVAADAVGCLVMGFNPGEVDYIVSAAERGLGCADPSAIEILGETIESVKRPFRRHTLDFASYDSYGIEIIEGGSCSGCRHFMEGFLTSLERKGDLELLRGKTLVMGQTVSIPDSPKGEIWLIGKCLRESRDAGVYVPGCPPHPHSMRKILEDRQVPEERN